MGIISLTYEKNPGGGHVINYIRQGKKYFILDFNAWICSGKSAPRLCFSTGKDLNEVAFEAVSSIADDSVELISIYYGSDASEKDAEALLAKCQEAFPEKDIELQFGGQPVYYFIISIE